MERSDVDLCLEVTDLSVLYGSRQALRDVSFSLARGVTGLLGPNGAGKSTLLRVLATVQIPSRGRVVATVGDEKVDDITRYRRLLGFLPQEPGFYPRFRVQDFVGHMCLLRDIAPARARRDEIGRVLTAVGLEQRARDRISSLSGGMRQRLGLACALLGDPSLIVLDEPTVGLDPEQRLRFREIIAGLGSRHTVLLSTHQTDDVASVCSRVVVLDEGVVRFDGTPGALAAVAQGRVWLSDRTEPHALASWATGTGHHRTIGDPPHDAALVEPALDDGYLVLLSQGRQGEGVRS